MKRLFVFLVAVCTLLGAGLAVPRLALAQPLCTPLGGSGTSDDPFLYRIDEPTEATGSTEHSECFIPTNTFGPPGTTGIDILEPGHFTVVGGQPVPNGGDPTPVSEHAQISFISPPGLPCNPFCTDIDLQSDPAAAGTETGLPLTPGCGSGNGCVLFSEDAQTGIAHDPNDLRGIPCGTSGDGTTACLIIQSDGEASGQVPEPSTGLLLGAVLPGLFGFRRLSRRDL